MLLIGFIMDSVALSYLMFFSRSSKCLYRFFEPVRHVPGLSWLLAIVLLVGWFLLLTAMIMPLDLKVEIEKPKDIISYNISLVLMVLVPFFDFAFSWLFHRDTLLGWDRTALMLVGIGIIPMVMATLSGMARALKPAIVITSIAVAFWLFYYVGLWLSGAMGNLLQILVWHGLMFSGGLASFNSWRFSLDEGSGDGQADGHKKVLE